MRAHRGWRQTGGLAGAGAAGLLVIAGCTGTGPGALGSLAKVTIVSGNLTFSSAATGAGHTAALVRRSLDHRAGGAIVAGLSGPGSHETASGGIKAKPAPHRRSAAVPGPPGGQLHPWTCGRTWASGSYAPGSRSWRTRWALAPSQTYRVTATAVDSAGQRTMMASDFRTLRPRRSFAAATVLGAGETVGVGMPVMINFSRPIADRAAVERAVRIWLSKPVTGAWYWVNSKSVWFRPRRYWPAHTRVRFTAHLAGLPGAPGVYGESDLTQHFRIGDSLIAVASAATHQMRVWWNGRLAGNWPVSTGRPGMDTPDGQYLSFAKGSPAAGTWGDGWTIYFLSWRKLLAGSATGDAVLVSRGGSRLAAAASAAR